jgi:hypothetical protein
MPPKMEMERRMARRRRQPERGTEARLWATKMNDPEMARDSEIMLAALREVAGTLPPPAPDPDPREVLTSRLEAWADRLGRAGEGGSDAPEE